MSLYVDQTQSKSVVPNNEKRFFSLSQPSIKNNRRPESVNSNEAKLWLSPKFYLLYKKCAKRASEWIVKKLREKKYESLDRVVP